MCYKIISTILLLILTVNIGAQALDVDSLIAEVKNLPDNKTKVDLLNEISKQYIDGKNAYDIALKYAGESVELAKKINYDYGLAHAYRRFSYTFKIQNKLDSARKYADLVLDTYERMNDKIGLEWYYKP